MNSSDVFPEIPGYRIEKKLGSGGMAKVYLGTQEALDRKVAIKVLNPQMVENHQLVNRFLNEARTASQLEHPSIVTIHDVKQIGGICYIVMEYLPDSLIDRIRSNPKKKLDPPEALRIVRQMARALAYAHRQGFIHRDIKPDNILFRKDDTPVLVDFGIARAVDATTRLTTVGMIIGTPHYMSPEQCRGEEINGQSDIYSLGIVFYEMLTGEIPYRADSAAGLLVKHIQEPLPPLPDHLSKYQPLLDRMTAKSRKKRAVSGEELETMFNSYSPRGGLDTIEARREEGWVFEGDSTPTRAESGFGMREEEPTLLTPYAVKSPKKKKTGLVFAILALFLVAAAAGAYFMGLFPGTGPADDKKNKENIVNVDVNEPEIKQEGPSEKNGQDTQPGRDKTPGAVKNTPGDKPPVDDEQSNQPKQPKPDPKADPLAKEKEYRRHFILAEEYFKSSDLKKAQENLDLARAAKETDELNALQEQIDDKIIRQKNEAFNKHLNRARELYNAKNYSAAKGHITKAHKIKRTAESQKLERKITQDEKNAARKAQREKRIKRMDDQAYSRARSANTVFSYEKYLKQNPKGRHAQEAQKRLDQLKQAMTLENKIEDDIAFEKAASAKTIKAYETYIEKYPLGLHVKEARAAITALKEKMIRETPVKVDIVQVRCFSAGGPKAPPMDQRKYSLRFARAQTRYIYVEVNYRNKFYGITDSRNRIRIVFAGAFTQEIKGVIRPSKATQTGRYSRGMGWAEAGKWSPGTYNITVYIEDQKVGGTRFEIY